MLDYHGDNVALSEFTSLLSAANFPDPAVARAQNKALEGVATESESALLGAFVHHLLSHAASDGAELALLQRAADLWDRGTALCSELGAIRADLEGAMEDPGAPGSADRFNTAAVSAQNFANTANAMRVEIDAFRADVLAFPHLPAHPRQQDRKTDTWDWGNLNLARRTDAFVRALFRQAADARSVAFAVGACASYGANVVGSAYIGHTVGGPRRTHRYRDRLARNAVGSWLASNHPASLSLSAMANRITFGSPADPTLPSELEALMSKALTDTFDVTTTLPVPDLQLGYRRLVQHLTLLDGFVRPPVPAPPTQMWMAKLFADTQNPPTSLRPQDVDVVGQDGGGVAVQYGGPPSTGSSSPDGSDNSKIAKGCGIAILVLTLIDLLQAFIQCIGQWANHHTCTFWDNMLLRELWHQDPPDPHDPTRPENPDVTAAQLTAIASSPQATQLVGILFDVHCQVWEAMDRAYAFFAGTGLIYPGDLVTMPLYAQFTSLPGALPWPHREEADPASTYHLYPSSPLENPTKFASPFPAEAHPDVYLTGELSNFNMPTLELWRQIAAGEFDSQNRDLDADRGFSHLCWAAGGSIHDDPIAVVILGYNEQ